MSLAQAMEHLAEGIRSTTIARSASLSDLRGEVEKHQQTVKKQMTDLHHENRHTARELRGKLTTQRGHMASEEKSRQSTARQETEQRRVAKSELRSSTHSLLSRARLERKETTKTLQEKISSEINDIQSAVNNICGAAKSMLNEIAADLHGAHEAWAEVKKKPRSPYPLRKSYKQKRSSLSSSDILQG